MTYIEFLFIFTIVPIIILAFLLRKELNAHYIRTLLLVSAIAFAATALWDNYAVYSGIWMFPPEKTLGIYLWYVPLEEYMFFFLQTYLTGLVQLLYLLKGGYDPRSGKEESRANVQIFPLIVLMSMFTLQQTREDVILLPFGKLNYLFHLFAWSGAFVLIQFIFGGRKIRDNAKLIIIPTLIMTAYFSLADSISIGNGIWSFDPEQTIGTKVGNVPLEEILFFFMTNLLVTEAMVLFLNQSLLKPKQKIS